MVKKRFSTSRKEQTFRIKPNKKNGFNDVVRVTKRPTLCPFVRLKLEENKTDTSSSLFFPPPPFILPVKTVTTNDIKFLSDLFKEIDLNNNGTIERSELGQNLKEHMSDAARNFLNDYLSQLDSDKDGEITFEELVATLYPGGTKKEYEKIIKVSLPGDVKPKKKVLGQLTQEEKDDFEELFALYDTDESGFVDIFEFKFGIQRTGLLENDLCDTVFESMDANEDGQVSIKEFLNFFARR